MTDNNQLLRQIARSGQPITAKEISEALGRDLVEVIRCKNCCHAVKAESQWLCYFEPDEPTPVEQDHYCAGGSRAPQFSGCENCDSFNEHWRGCYLIEAPVSLVDHCNLFQGKPDQIEV